MCLCHPSDIKWILGPTSLEFGGKDEAKDRCLEGISKAKIWMISFSELSEYEKKKKKR